MSEKKTLSTEEIEAQSALELPDREVLDGSTFTGPFIILNLAIAVNVCPAVVTAASKSAATTNCTAVAIATQKVG
jgi:hypothetical protein